MRSIKPSKKLLPRTSLSQTTPAQKHPLSRCVPALAQVIPAPQARPYLVLGLDATPNPRPYAPTLKDRTFIYQPNPIKGNKPINIGHPYSILSVLPEKTPHQSGTWVIPLSGVRVESELPGKGSWLTTNQSPAQSPSFF